MLSTKDQGNTPSVPVTLNSGTYVIKSRRQSQTSISGSSSVGIELTRQPSQRKVQRMRGGAIEEEDTSNVSSQGQPPRRGSNAKPPSSPSPLTPIANSKDHVITAVAGIRQRNRDFHRAFPANLIPVNEYCIEYYSCAFFRDVLREGRLYITPLHFCFYCPFPGLWTRLVIPVQEVTKIVRANTAYIIPNAIVIHTLSGQSYFFGSVRAREKAFDVLQTVWKKCIEDMDQADCEDDGDVTRDSEDESTFDEEEIDKEEETSSLSTDIKDSSHHSSRVKTHAYKKPGTTSLTKNVPWIFETIYTSDWTSLGLLFGAIAVVVLSFYMIFTSLSLYLRVQSLLVAAHEQGDTMAALEKSLYSAFSQSNSVKGFNSSS